VCGGNRCRLSGRMEEWGSFFVGIKKTQFFASFATNRNTTGRKNCSFAKTARGSVAANSDITILSILAAM